MPPRVNSRHQLCTAFQDENGRLFLEDREPFRFSVKVDTIEHTVREGDTLFSLSAYYYSAIKRPAGLWWVIADFQVPPIVDPTIQLRPGQLLYIPSLRVVQEDIFSERRRGKVVEQI